MTRCVLLIFCLSLTIFSFAQREGQVVVINNENPHFLDKYFLSGFPFSTSGTNHALIHLFPPCRFATTDFQSSEIITLRNSLSSTIQKRKFLKITGNILYDFNYYSRIDTPYFQKDVYQHTLQAYLDVQIQEKYPIRVFFTISTGNSHLLQNFSNLNFQFNQFDFSNKIKQRLKSAIPDINTDSLLVLKVLIDSKAKQLASLRHQPSNSARLQKMVEEREAEFVKSKKGVYKDSLSASEDSSKFFKRKETEDIALKMRKIDSLLYELKSLQLKLKALQSNARFDKVELERRIERATTAKEFKQLSDSLGLLDSILPKGYKFLSNIKSFGIGRCLIDYSELSAKNISVKGINLEYNPWYYFAIAAGSIDYRFRDFIIRPLSQTNQYLALVRFGKGMKDGNHLYLTYYSGKKQFYNSYTSQQVTGLPNYHLMGFAVEMQQKLGQNTLVTGEVAKSSIPFYKNINSLGSNNLSKDIFNFKEKSNEAYSIKLQTLVSATQTKIQGFYKSFGANFQSFSYFNSGSKQSAWSVRVDQPLFKKQLWITSSVRANDFSNPFVAQQFSSKTVFKSIQATMRVKKMPIVSVGYYPSSQISKIDEITYVENLFYTLNASAFHYYRIGGMLMTSGALYTQFYNRITDSNFVYFNARNMMLAQNISVGKWVLNANGLYSRNTDYNLYTIDGNAQVSIKSWLKLGAGLKYNWQTSMPIQRIGYSANAIIALGLFGEIQGSFDKGFLPGMNKSLVSNEVGRLTYTKTF